MTSKFTFSHFTPAEAERITGLGVGMQRDWRNRGFLPKNEGHARFDCFALAHLLFMKMMADRGIGPQKSFEDAPWCAVGMVAAALQEIDAYEGDHEQALAWNVPVGGEFCWGAKANWLTRSILDANGHGVQPAPLFISWADGSHVFHYSFDTAIAGMNEFDVRREGPMILLDLRVLGGLLLDRCARPIVHVDLSDLLSRNNPATPEMAGDEIAGDPAGGGPP